MKKMIIAMVTLLTMSVTTANAMSYEQARNEALFLTDKMAYELNLTDEQYEAAYEINLDYLMGVTSQADVFGTYWERRNLDLSYILLDWQWRAFLNATYFYRPLYWDAGYWHFGIYARYPRRDYFYFGRPAFYATYRGAHAWHRIGGHGFYHGRRDHFHHGRPNHFGMRDGWDRGDYRGGHDIRHSSTRTTVGHHPGGHIDTRRPGDTRERHGNFGTTRRHDGYTPRTNNGYTPRTHNDATPRTHNDVTPRTHNGFTPRTNNSGFTPRTHTTPSTPRTTTPSTSRGGNTFGGSGHGGGFSGGHGGHGGSGHGGSGHGGGSFGRHR